ncbi:MAG: GatB/YqeY domain-containing protein [Rhodospirillales bacterium]|nr:GatB/YqeY domain-containing protein [Alphaproteobacteria bacterium]USO03049.1 MAG: GatB/YqeY domain-containing protein [Rhodospirillales bacterium]
MSKREDFNSALKEALKAKDQVALSTIRLILAALKDRDISARGQGNAEGVSDSEILSMLQSMIKQRQESSETYAGAGREDLAQRERDEIRVIQTFLPAQLSDEEVGKVIEDLIAETGAGDIKDMGKVMAELKNRYAGQIDMGKAGGAVKQKLA